MNGVVLLELKIILLQPPTRTFSENGKVGNRNQLFTSRNRKGESVKTDDERLDGIYCTNRQIEVSQHGVNVQCISIVFPHR